MLTVWSGGEGLTGYQGPSSLAAFRVPLVEADEDGPGEALGGLRPRHSRVMFRDLTPIQRARICRLVAAGMPVSQVCRRYRVVRAEINRVVAAPCRS